MILIDSYLSLYLLIASPMIVLLIANFMGDK